MPNSRLILESKKFKKKHKSTLIVKYKKNLILTITSSGQKNTKIKIRITGTKGSIDLIVKDMFECFRSALKEFILSVQTKVKFLRGNFRNSKIN